MLYSPRVMDIHEQALVKWKERDRKRVRTEVQPYCRRLDRRSSSILRTRFVAFMSVSRPARSTGDLRGPNIHSASSRRTHHDSAFESAPVTHTACLRHVHYTGSDSFP